MVAPLIIAVPSRRRSILVVLRLTFIAITFLYVCSPVDAQPLVPGILAVIERTMSEYIPQGTTPDRLEVGRLVLRTLGDQRTTGSNDQTPIDLMTIDRKGGQVVTIVVRSDVFYPVVWIMDPDGELLLAGDEGHVEKTAKFSTVLPRDGNYILAVSSHGKTGEYEVQVVQDAGFVAPVVSSVSSRHDRRAILVGINDYMGLRDDLHGPVHDVQAVKELLQTYVGFQEEEILVIENHHATLSNIRDSIESFLGPLPADASALFYFSGHGVKLIAADDLYEKDRRD